MCEGTGGCYGKGRLWHGLGWWPLDLSSFSRKDFVRPRQAAGVDAVGGSVFRTKLGYTDNKVSNRRYFLLIARGYE